VANSPSYRMLRIAEAMQVELSLLLQQQARDPRFALVTVTACEVAKDLAHAKVYVSIAEECGEDDAETLKALQKAAGYFRYQLAQQMTLRVAPELRFIQDKSFHEGHRMSRLIDQAIKSDPTFDEA
jgi:ribosome-binding factor A